jgi:hypothetical protein
MDHQSLILHSLYSDAMAIESHLNMERPINRDPQWFYIKQAFVFYYLCTKPDRTLLFRAWHTIIELFEEEEEEETDLFERLRHLLNYPAFSFVKEPRWPFLFFIYLWFDSHVPTKEHLDCFTEQLDCFFYLTPKQITGLLHKHEYTFILRLSTSKEMTLTVNYRSLYSRTLIHLRIPLLSIVYFLGTGRLYAKIFFFLFKEMTTMSVLSVLCALEPEWRRDEYILNLLDKNMTPEQLWDTLGGIYPSLNKDFVQLSSELLY